MRIITLIGILACTLYGCSITTDINFNAHLEYVTLGKSANADLNTYESDTVGDDNLK